MKLKLGYDNLQDASSKLVGTFCMYKGKAIVVKDVQTTDPDGYDKGEYRVYWNDMEHGRTGTPFLMEDPEFNCSHYNLGYVNRMQAASWFYRLPQKQWKQGLRHDQLGQKVSARQYYGAVEFRASPWVGQMLEDLYPSFKEAIELLKRDKAEIVAFHRNFAAKYNRMHQDFVVEYKGDEIGVTHDAHTFKLTDRYQHLNESLQEAVYARA